MVPAEGGPKIFSRLNPHGTKAKFWLSASNIGMGRGGGGVTPPSSCGVWPFQYIPPHYPTSLTAQKNNRETGSPRPHKTVPVQGGGCGGLLLGGGGGLRHEPAPRDGPPSPMRAALRPMPRPSPGRRPGSVTWALVRGPAFRTPVDFDFIVVCNGSSFLTPYELEKRLLRPLKSQNFTKIIQNLCPKQKNTRAPPPPPPV